MDVPEVMTKLFMAPQFLAICAQMFLRFIPRFKASQWWENDYFATFAVGTIISMHTQDHPPSLALLLVRMVNPSLVSLPNTHNALQGAYKSC
jgi:hypothetical protein